MTIDERRLGNPGTPDFRVDRYPFYLLNRAVARYNSIIEVRLRAIGLDIPSWRVLMILGEQHPLGIRQVSQAAVINLSTMTRIVQRMRASGLVTTSSSAADQRVTEVDLTSEGLDKLSEARLATAPIYAAVVDGMSAKTFSRLISQLNEIYEKLDKLDPAEA